jgi:hypothetical protein
LAKIAENWYHNIGPRIFAVVALKRALCFHTKEIFLEKRLPNFNSGNSQKKFQLVSGTPFSCPYPSAFSKTDKSHLSGLIFNLKLQSRKVKSKENLKLAED